MSIFAEWDKAYDAKEMKKEVKEAAEKSKDFDELKPGTYPMYIKQMELTETKETKAPMLAIQLKVSDGEFKGRMLFVNFVLTSPYVIHKANTFLKGLGTDVTVEFDSYGQYADMVDDIFNWAEKHEADYDVEYSITENKGKSYNEYKVAAVYTN